MESRTAENDKVCSHTSACVMYRDRKRTLGMEASNFGRPQMTACGSAW